MFQGESVAIHSRLHQHQDHGDDGKHGHEQEYQDEEHVNKVKQQTTAECEQCSQD